ncbi:hypothetical protein AURDEDRAFT_130506 [Auricularia subglabra TFB-10046 SS5]|uniref:Uncharacterized protein n=1 Tax=Auricularia subglabra (strain TFB-10046 / SS5) TaxID=717982 RepID=J0LF44_AURST|nr:hypothetical protein AURDEDRAFT_130506 [Auricularia subglabra TFB-10046 SS5]
MVQSAQNIDLAELILPRFGFLGVVKVDRMADKLLARVVSNRLRSNPSFVRTHAEHDMEVETSLDADIFLQEMLRKYIMYARDRLHPKLHDLDREKSTYVFSDLWGELLATRSVSINASVKMRCADNIDFTVSVAGGSFACAQKLKKTPEREYRECVTVARGHAGLFTFILCWMVKQKQPNPTSES